MCGSWKFAIFGPKWPFWAWLEGFEGFGRKKTLPQKVQKSPKTFKNQKKSNKKTCCCFFHGVDRFGANLAHLGSFWWYFFGPKGRLHFFFKKKMKKKSQKWCGIIKKCSPKKNAHFNPHSNGMWPASWKCVVLEKFAISAHSGYFGLDLKVLKVWKKKKLCPKKSKNRLKRSKLIKTCCCFFFHGVDRFGAVSAHLGCLRWCFLGQKDVCIFFKKKNEKISKMVWNHKKCSPT